MDARLEVTGFGTLTVDTALGGDRFVIVEAKALGFDLTESEAAELAKCGIKITAAVTEQLGFTHPDNPDWRHIYFCAFAGPLEESKSGLASRSTVVIRPGKIDRSPTGTAVSARMAVMAARGQMHVDQKFFATSIIGSQFTRQIVSQTQIGGKAAIIPQISGRGWITGVHQHTLDPVDPWPEGYRLGYTWGH